MGEWYNIYVFFTGNRRKYTRRGGIKNGMDY